MHSFWLVNEERMQYIAICGYFKGPGKQSGIDEA